MQNLVPQLRYLSRLAAAPQPCEEVDLRTVTKDVVTVIARLAIAEGRNLSYEATDVPSFTEGNSAAIAEALANIVRTGFATRLPPLASISLWNSQRAFACPTNDKERLKSTATALWNRYTKDPQKRDSGLGLAILDQVMCQHGGDAEIESRPEDGARV